MSRPRLRALVLAAGHGRRLEPLTSFCPKPLLPVAGVPILGRTLSLLRAAGCEEAVVNLHHLGARIREALGGEWEGMPLRWSEEPLLLGTLGALAPVRDRLAEADAILVVNGDSLCRWPIRALVRRHLRKQAAATLLVHRRAPRAELGGGVALDRRQRVVAIRDSPPTGPVERRGIFAGAQVIAPRLLEGLRAEPGDLVADLYQPLLAADERLEAVLTGRRWHDLGTPRRYLDGCLDHLRGLRPAALWRETRIDPEARVATPEDLRRTIVEARAEIGPGARLERTLVLEGAVVPAGCRLAECIVGPGVRLPAPAEIERRLVTRVPVETRLRPEQSQIGDLLYTPLDGG